MAQRDHALLPADMTFIKKMKKKGITKVIRESLPVRKEMKIDGDETKTKEDLKKKKII